jgi:hypothetical protein
MKTGKALATIAGLALLPLIPYAVWGYSGQDFEYHATCWMALRGAWQNGEWMPMWDPRANFGMGDVHLGLYPPGAMYAGALLALLLPFRFVPAAFVWLAVALSGAAMHFASREFVAERDRLPAALLYMLSPYLLTTALVRFAAGELLVQALLPLILLCFYRAVWRRHPQDVLVLALLLGVSWFTNVPESVVLFYCLGIVAALCAWRQRTLRPLLRMAVAQVFALSLAAFYLAPLWQERAWINQTGLKRLDPRGLLLFMPYRGAGVEQQKIFKYSCWLFACAGIVLLAGCLWRRTRPFCFQLPLALPVWRHLPQMALVAFPFRFLPLLGAALPLVLLDPATRPRRRTAVYLAVGCLTLLPFFENVRLQRTPSTRVPPFAELESRWKSVGYEGMPEFVPLGATRPKGPSEKPGPAILNSAQAECTDPMIDDGPAYFFIRTAQPCKVRPGVYFYPYLRASDQTGASLPVSADPRGLLLITVPPGYHEVSVNFVPHSRVRTVSRWASAVALLVLVLGLAPVHIPKHSLGG